PLDISVQRDGGDYATHFGRSENLTANVQDFSYSFTSNVTDAIAKLKFYVGGNATCVYIDKVSFVDQSGATSLPDAFKAKEDGAWTVFPNPFDHQIVVKSKMASNSSVHYQIYSVNGQLASQGILDEQ